MRRVFAWFSHFCMSLLYLCPILAKTIRLSKDNSKIINSSFSQRVCVHGLLLEVKISAISCKLKATYVFVFVLSAILNASILEPKISTRYHVYDCEDILVALVVDCQKLVDDGLLPCSNDTMYEIETCARTLCHKLHQIRLKLHKEL